METVVWKAIFCCSFLITLTACKESILPAIYDAESTGQISSNPSHYEEVTSRAKRQTCDNSAFRTLDGTCNNMNNPTWGSVSQNFRRLLTPVYDDDLGTPRMTGVNDVPLPNVRTVSNNVHFELDRPTNRQNVMVMQWGQFLDHDLTGTPVTTENNAKIECCNAVEDVTTNPSNPCFPISLPAGDTHFPSTDCMNFVRSEKAEGTGEGQVKRQQKNSLTSFIDGSQIYGVSTEQTEELMETTGGLMKVAEGDLLPAGDAKSCVLDSTDSADYCFVAGDTRVNVFPGLSALHTLFVREHNRIARTLASLQPTWTHERLFNEARKIVGAELQVITYNQWLPEILGSNAMTQYGLTSGNYEYNATINPTLSNVFSTAAFRFGHTMIPKTLTFESQPVSITAMFNRPSYVRKNIASVFTGLLGDADQRVDAWYSDEMRNQMFETTNKTGMDVVALNIQRGRDHGLPGYNEWRTYCNLPTVTDPRAPGQFGGRAGRDISNTYSNSPDDIDLYTGGVSEVPVPQGVVGSLYACLLGEQFRDLKYGDSYWYQTTDPVKGFTASQIASLETVSLSRIICDNTDLTTIQRRPFLQPVNNNVPVECDSPSVPSVDLSLWGPDASPDSTSPDQDEGQGQDTSPTTDESQPRSERPRQGQNRQRQRPPQGQGRRRGPGGM